MKEPHVSYSKSDNATDIATTICKQYDVSEMGEITQAVFVRFADLIKEKRADETD